MQQPIRLYKQCQMQVINYLKTGWVKRSSDNPFCPLPCGVYHDLVDYTLSLPCHEVPEISKLCLLLINFRLHRLDLSCFEVSKGCATEAQEREREKCGSLIRHLSRYTFPNLQAIIVPLAFCYTSDELGDLIRGCPNLRAVHSATYFDLSSIENGRRLRIVRIHSTFYEITDFLEKRAYCLIHLEDLNVLAVCDPEPCLQIYKNVANILIHCRNILSVGMADSSKAIDYIINERSHADLDFPFAFRLRRCFWGYSYDSQLEISEESFKYSSNYTNIIQTAATACPLVEELVMQVFQKENLQSLVLLTRLTLLSIDFSQCHDNYLPEFLSLLSEIGYRLKHLSIEGNVRFPVNVICNYCVNLESLKIKGLSSITDPAEPCVGIQNLKRFSVNSVDQDCFDFVLKNCRNVMELFLGRVLYLDDKQLYSILKKNTLSRLELLSISVCNLTEHGLNLLVKNARNLKDFYLGFPRNSLLSVIRESNRKINFIETPVDFFRHKLDKCNF
ncbi:uncharacterized protein CDAR_291551 [Caerostris darwini]|uniref:Uncharacterized protein n=1 Tax=Caerostris darwini TaxID=1538125 RepID=A0AAV4RMQ7_9ARAC|nr:uncharacterized protein CDAR_291551 [Caerostris darwini]